LAATAGRLPHAPEACFSFKTTRVWSSVTGSILVNNQLDTLFNVFIYFTSKEATTRTEDGHK